MQRKPVPPAPKSLEDLHTILEVVPLVPKPEDDCCERVVSRTAVSDRGTASSWLVFLAALGLTTESSGTYARIPADSDQNKSDRNPDMLAERFKSNVFLAAESVDALTENEQSATDVFEHVRERVPRWERTKRTDWEAFWTGRVERRLDWAVLFDLAKRTPNGYRVVEQ